MKDICLIIPPAPFLGDQKRNCPLGILYIAAYLEACGVDVCVADLRGMQYVEICKIPKAKWYGLGATTPEYIWALDIAKHMRIAHPCKIILGGSHATAIPESIDPVFDHVVTGEGETAALAIVKGYNTGRIVRHPFINRLDDIPFPARHLLPRSSVVSDKLCMPGVLATTMMISRGCAYDCSFCSSKSMWGRRLRYRSVSNVISEIKDIIQKYNVYCFRFQDDTMTINRPWVENFCEEVKKANLNILWRVNTRIDNAELHIFERMKQAGCYEVGFGIEDPRDYVRKINNKQIDPEMSYCAIENARKAGLKTRIFLMIGLPGQDTHTAQTMIDYIERTQPDAVDVSTFVPFPGSDIYNNPMKYGFKMKDHSFSDYVFTVGLYKDELEKDFIYDHDIMTNEELKNERRKILEYISKRNLVFNR